MLSSGVSKDSYNVLICIKREAEETEEIIPQLRALAALLEDKGAIPLPTICNYSLTESNAFSGPL